MTLRDAFALLPLLLTGAAAPTAAQSDTLRLSLEDAVRLAQEQNPGFLAARNDRSTANWEVREAVGSLFPSATLGGSLSWQGPGEQRFGSLTLAQDLPAYYLSAYNVGISYQLSASALLAPAVAHARREAVVARIDAARVELMAAVTRAYLEVLRQAEGEILAELQLGRARFNLRLAEAQQEVGAVTPLDVRQAEVQVGRAEVALLQARNALSTARLRLLQQIGMDGDRPLALTTTFDLKEPEWNGDDLLATALKRNPTLLAGAANLDASRAQVRQARSAYLPSLVAQAGIGGFTRQASSTDVLVTQAQMQLANQAQQCALLNQVYTRLVDPLPTSDCSAFTLTDDMRNRIVTENGAFPFDFTRRPTSASLSISLPIFQGLQRERQLEAARVQRSDAELEIRERRLALTADLTIALRTLVTAYQSAALEARNSEVADDQLRLAGERYRLGAISFVDLVDAETVKAEADRAYVNAVYAYHDALTQLETVVGTELRD